MRRGDWKQTYSGVAFWPLDPTPEDVRIEDIAHALACVNRYGGHAPAPYSVAQHSVYVSRRAAQLAPAEVEKVARWGLLHDAAEAYLGDMVRPLKRTPEMAAFRAAEAQVMAAICARFGLPAEEPFWVKHADSELLATEAARFFPVDSRPAPWGPLPAPLALDIEPWGWREAEERFLQRFYKLWPEAL